MRKLLLATIAASALAAGSAFAADLPARVDAPAPAPIFSVFNWSGFYVGAVAGYGWGESRHCDAVGCVGGAPTFPQPQLDGATIGGTIGYNYQIGSAVLGIEADYSWANIKGTANSTGTFGCGGVGGCRTEIDGFGTLRLRAGYAFGNFLPYITGGLAVTNLNASIGNPVLASGSETQAGWTVGAGFEYAITHNWSAKVEYLHVFNDTTFNYAPAFCVAPGCQTKNNSIDLVRVGINYRFGGPAGAVVAKY